MPRGSNNSSETERVSRMERDNVRPGGMSDTGVNRDTKIGFGRDSMQKNKGMKSPKMDR